MNRLKNMLAVGLLLGVPAMGMSSCGLLQAVISDMASGEVSEEYTPENEYYIGRGVSSSVTVVYAPADLNKSKEVERIVYLNEMGGFVYMAADEVTRDDYTLGDHISRDEDEQRRVDELSLFKGVHVGLLDTEEVCAFATPGGFIWVSKGAIAICENEDELAAIICHEMGHTVMNHGMDAYREANDSQVQDSATFSYFSDKADAVPGAGEFANFIGSYADQMIDQGYNQDQEFEADNWGTRALAKSGYDPNAMVRLLQRVQAYEESHPEIGKYLENHPPVEDRIEKVQEVIEAEKLKPAANTMTPEGQSARGARFLDTFKK